MMNNRNAITRPALALLLVLLLSGFMQDEWVFVSPDKKFSVEFPAALMTPAEGVEGGDEEGNRRMMWATEMTSSGLCMLMYSDFAKFPDSNTEEFRNQIFQIVYKGFLRGQSPDYKIVSERPVKSGKFFGREFKAVGVMSADSSSFFSNAQVFIAGKRIYMLTATNKFQEADPAMSRRFFNSFKILKK